MESIKEEILRSIYKQFGEEQTGGFLHDVHDAELRLHDVVAASREVGASVAGSESAARAIEGVALERRRALIRQHCELSTIKAHVWRAIEFGGSDALSNIYMGHIKATLEQIVLTTYPLGKAVVKVNEFVRAKSELNAEDVVAMEALNASFEAVEKSFLAMAHSCTALKNSLGQ